MLKMWMPNVAQYCSKWKVGFWTLVVLLSKYSKMSAQILPWTPAKGRMTPQEVMQMDTFEDFTEEQATEVLSVFRTFCEIAYSICSKQERKSEKSTIELSPHQQLKAA